MSLRSNIISSSALVVLNSSRASSLALTNRPLDMYQGEGLHDVLFVSVHVGNIRLNLNMDYESVCGLVALGSYSRDREGRVGCGIDGQLHITSISITPSDISGNFLDYFGSPVQTVSSCSYHITSPLMSYLRPSKNLISGFLFGLPRGGDLCYPLVPYFLILV